MGSRGQFAQRLKEAEDKKKKEQADADLFNRLSSMEEQLSFLKKQGESVKQTPSFASMQPQATIGQRQAGLRISQEIAPSRVRRMNRSM